MPPCTSSSTRGGNQAIGDAACQPTPLHSTGRIAFGLLLCVGALIACPSVAAAGGSPSPVTLYVNGTSGTVTTGCTATGAAACKTIPEGVAASEALSDAAVTLDVAPGTYDEQVTIDPPSTDTLTIQRNGSLPVTIDDPGVNSEVVFDGPATMVGLTIKGGKATAGGGVYANSGGGLVTLEWDSISDNSATRGGGVFNNSSHLSLKYDTISANTASGDGGGVYDIEGVLTLDDDTISGNTTSGDGGGIIAVDSNETVTDDTISGNSAGQGGAIYNLDTSTIDLADSILADNTPGNCQYGVTDDGYNVADDSSCDLGSKSISTSSTIGTLTLASNGSIATQTEAITASSSAFDEVPPADCTLKIDERGLPRPGAGDGNCDAGAFELQGASQTISFAGPGPGTVGSKATLTATGGASGNPVIFSVDASSGTGVCSVVGATVSYLKVGTCALDANQTGNADYDPAPQVTRDVTVTVQSSGYDLVGSDGGVFVFPTGQAGGFYGSLPGLKVSVDDIVGMVPTANDEGYFLVGSDGGVFAFGNAPFENSLPGLNVHVNDIVGIVPTSNDQGYFLVGSDGGVFTFGNAPFLGSLPAKGISVDDITGIAADPADTGYWVVGATGTVYAFGTATNFGSATGTTSPVSAIVSTSDGGGYWIVTQDGDVYSFGDAGKYGNLPALGVTPAHKVIGLVPTSDDAGYWLIGSDGGIFAFGDAPFVGSLPGLGVSVTNVVGAVPTHP